MTDITANAERDIETLRSRRGWFIVLGLALIALGVIAFANLYVATVATVYYVGILMIAGAVAQMVMAFGVKGWTRAIFLIGTAILYGLAGLFAFMDPLLASTIITLLLAAMLIASGIVRIVLAMRERPRKGWGWVLTTGILSIIVALVVMAGWPVDSLWILGLFLSVDLISQGLGWLFVGIGLGRV